VIVSCARPAVTWKDLGKSARKPKNDKQSTIKLPGYLRVDPADNPSNPITPQGNHFVRYDLRSETKPV
jgi:hypothetical protein